MNKQTRNYGVLLSLRPAAADFFSQYTANHIGTNTAFTLDKKVLVSSTIDTQIPGTAEVVTPYTRSQVIAIISLLKYPPLPVAFQISKETAF